MTITLHRARPARSARTETAPWAPEPGQPLVRLEQVGKAYPTAAGAHWALKGVTAQFAQGEFAAIVGRSGAGKSTLANMLTGADRLTEGAVCVGDMSLHNLSEDALARWRGRHIGVVYQTFELLPQISLLDNVLLPMELCGLYRGRASAEYALELLDLVGLAAHAYKTPDAISGGQKQRAAIARALANDPVLVVGDEPTGNLDSETAESVLGIFEALARRGRTVIVMTHDAEVAQRATHVLHLADGEIVDEIHQ